METADNGRDKPHALALLASERPRNVGWLKAAGILFGDWGTSRLYVLGLAMFFAGRTSFWLICINFMAVSHPRRYCNPAPRSIPTAAFTAKHKALRRRRNAFLRPHRHREPECVQFYFGLPISAHEHLVESTERPHFTKPIGIATDKYDTTPGIDAGEDLTPHRESPPSAKEKLLTKDSPHAGDCRDWRLGLFNADGAKTHGSCRGAAINGFHHPYASPLLAACRMARFAGPDRLIASHGWLWIALRRVDHSLAFWRRGDP